MLVGLLIVLNVNEPLGTLLIWNCYNGIDKIKKDADYMVKNKYDIHIICIVL